VTERSVSVTTALGYADENGARVFTGTLEGTLTSEQRGTNGFGYDSIFVPAGSHLTFAEMSSAEKNAISHRKRAVEALRTGLGLFHD
jgi:XTP/dITP diphosphohydrolase